MKKDNVIALLIGFSLSLLVSFYTVEYKNHKLEKQVTVLEQRNDGLHKQLQRTQYQLKKVSEESADKTAKIADLTGNGG